jgi:folate-dependent phosphoribosylglycinamide formyltransferase PurN
VYQIGWFSTGRDEAGRELFKAAQDSIHRGEIRAEMAFVFSNREPGESEENDRFLSTVRSYPIPLICLSSRKFRPEVKEKSLQSWRLEYDREVMKRLEPFHPDLCVLAGYMLIVGEEMCQKYNMINLHPAPPGGPTGTWQEVIWKLIESRAQEGGAMMHLVTPELDKGPPVTYCTFPIQGKSFHKLWQELKSSSTEAAKEMSENYPRFRLIREQELAREFPLMIATIKAFSEGKVKILAGNVVNYKGRPINGYNLTGEIEGMLKRRNLQ